MLTRVLGSMQANETEDGRLMHHWLYRPVLEGEPIDGEHCGNHRFHWEEYLTPQLMAALSPEQREVLMLGESFEIDPVNAATVASHLSPSHLTPADAAQVYHGEREKELGSVRWGTREQLEAEFAEGDQARL